MRPFHSLRVAPVLALLISACAAPGTDAEMSTPVDQPAPADQATIVESPPQPTTPVGYDDTPMLPGMTWRVHDKNRPVPAVVTPGLAGSPPSDAVVLFDGSDTDGFTGGPWDVVDGALVVNGTGDIFSVEQFGDVQLHIEWASPAGADSESQGRGNSGVFFFGRYEVQVLDSWGNRSYADGQAGALYGQYPPDVNACRGPGVWQTYDIAFTAPRFKGDRLVSPARVTVFHNGVLIHNARAMLGPTAHKSVPTYTPHEAAGSIKLQDHGNPVRYRNIWARRLD